ncbi:caspase domain-containing protein [Roridomyces roridus]|uniref:Caspase domain-containing protein n=1 Tax=Roridomyces roridus TaxID=1738132 RepID=A0AAD7C0B4_9AGAR|nr:caspase domain-containing protein [Roridomyces roridus]
MPSSPAKSEPTPSSSYLCWEPSKKALLVGINSLSAPDPALAALRGPHHDVAQMKMLLQQTYGYKPEDILVLVDDGVPGHPQPDKRNIMMAIKDLVSDVKKGDKLFFQYCGHTIQIPSQSDAGESRLIECLVPLDGEDNVIKDNELRECLVDTLPVGATLVAVFDSCHSATLLDLEHTRCNRVFVPWLSKGKCKNDEQSRKLTLDSPSVLTRSRTIYQTARTSPTRIRSRRTSIDSLCSPILPLRSAAGPPPSPSVAYRTRSPLSPINTRSLEPIGVFIAEPRTPPASDAGSGPGPTSPTVSLSRRLSISRSPVITRRARVPPALKLWTSAAACPATKENLPPPPQGQDHRSSDRDNAVQSLSPASFLKPCLAHDSLPSALPSSVTLSASPLSAYCRGWCRTCGGPTDEVANVISLSACKDSELSWENEEGVGMTQALMQVLNETPHPTLRDLVTRVRQSYTPRNGAHSASDHDQVAEVPKGQSSPFEQIGWTCIRVVL